MKANGFKMPNPVTINGRSSSLTNAFVNGIIPCLKPTEKEIVYALGILGQTTDNVFCVYCGDKATEWDHLNPLIVKQKPTGYISEIKNLVPACGKCNQSKGNKKWREWIKSNAKLSPFTRRIKDIEDRIKAIELYEKTFKPKTIDFERIVGVDLWKIHWNNHKILLDTLKQMQTISDEIREKLKSHVELNEDF
jgi:hypothetical protein